MMLHLDAHAEKLKIIMLGVTLLRVLSHEQDAIGSVCATPSTSRDTDYSSNHEAERKTSTFFTNLCTTNF